MDIKSILKEQHPQIYLHNKSENNNIYMNRIVLIGNGFDLAHGLKTSYKDFIDEFWDGFMNHCINQDRWDESGQYKYECIELQFNMEDQYLSRFLPNIENPSILKEKKPIKYEKLVELIQKLNAVTLADSEKIIFYIKNRLLLHLIKKCSTFKNWVDIENEYYNSLTNILNEESSFSIDQLNSDFDFIRNKLHDYLLQYVQKVAIDKNDKIYNLIYDSFYLRDFTKNGQLEIAEWELKKINNFRAEVKNYRVPDISIKTQNWMKILGELEISSEVLRKELLDKQFAKDNFEIHPDWYLFLNFNYTSTEKIYNDGEFEHETIHIHGELDKWENKIILGYGDELEENYSKLEDLRNNAFLENIKSIHYQETDNYKKMLEFIDSNMYQIIILGHSCGNSDRTLLNTLFEHENCVSIKPYYYRYREDGSNDTKDNYSDIVRNISRNFKDKKSMRDKVVNKKYCDWFSEDIKE